MPLNALGISGFSEVRYEFARGPGQLAFHGTPRPNEVGQNLSNGCVRVPDDVVLKIARSAPLGTPVVIA
jgi:lipoprotein-anchoring transpeptidase ErfK/SrfK